MASNDITAGLTKQYYVFSDGHGEFSAIDDHSAATENLAAKDPNAPPPTDHTFSSMYLIEQAFDNSSWCGNGRHLTAGEVWVNFGPLSGARVK